VRVVTGGTRDSTYGGRFTGEVELEMLHATPTDEEPDTALVHFHGGAVTNWHHHPGGQLLFVVSGRGRVGTREEHSVELAVGTLVVAPPDEQHWHGAAAGEDCTLLAVTWGTTCWHDEAPPVGT
jgi:quercetin dioxygenase-like cupin family protein